MNYRLEVKESLDKRLKKFSKEDKETLRLIHRKVQDILKIHTALNP
jgi:mRNA-degrading endonuclease RelE of RelBE toxin-antitoxin system